MIELNGCNIKNDWNKMKTNFFENFDSTSRQSLLAFTLSEILITLGIIGVVAALTIPTLMQNIQEAQFKTAWKKNYSVISQAWERVKQDEGGDLSAYFDTALNYQTDHPVAELANYLSVVQSCGTFDSTSAGDYYYACGVSTSAYIGVYKTLSGQLFDDRNISHGQYVLKDGSTLYFRTFNQGWLLIFVDVNGFSKGPNILGKDLFGISVTKDAVRPMGAPGTGVDGSCVNTVFNPPPENRAYGFGSATDCSGVGCSAEYLYK